MAAPTSSWSKFEMEPLDSASLPPEKGAPDFTSLHAGVEKGAEFIPLEQSTGEHKEREQAVDIVKQAQEKAGLLEQEAYEQGFVQGEKDGLDLGEKKAVKVIENLENLCNEISRLKENLVTRYEEEILELIFAIAGKVIHCRMGFDEKFVRETVTKALHLATDKSKIVLKVSPQDFEYIETLRPEFFTQHNELKSLTVTQDPSITRGGCLLETPYGDVDGRVETQLEKICQCLEEVFERKRDG
jgi:flagellar assembly protein FliH